MPVVYTYPIPKGKLILLGSVALAYPTYNFLSMAYTTGQRSLEPGHRWWELAVHSLLIAGFGALLLYAHRGYFRRGWLELEGSRLTIHFGAGIQNPGILGGTTFKGDALQIDLQDAFLEWAGLALNVRTQRHGTLALAYGDAAKPLADWLAANGHSPVRAY